MSDHVAGGSSTQRSTNATPEGYRLEHDSMGEVLVPVGAKWQAQTQRAVENFPVSGLRIERSLIRALALIKGAAARENAKLGVITPEAAEAIAGAASEVAGVASIRWVRPAFTTLANSAAFCRSDPARWVRAGTSAVTTPSTAAYGTDR